MIDYVVLKNELTTDPAARGYASPLDVGNHTAVEKLLNAGVTALDRNEVPTKELISILVYSEVKALTAAQREILRLYFSVEVLPIKSADVRAMFTDLFTATGTGTTRNRLAALQQKQGSRMEVLFGEGTQATVDDIVKALRS